MFDRRNGAVRSSNYQRLRIIRPVIVSLDHFWAASHFRLQLCLSLPSFTLWTLSVTLAVLSSISSISCTFTIRTLPCSICLILFFRVSLFISLCFVFSSSHVSFVSASYIFRLYCQLLFPHAYTVFCYHSFTWFPLSLSVTFFDASSHLYKKVCPSVRRSVCRSVRRSVRPSVCSSGTRFFKWADNVWKWSEMTGKTI